MTNSGLEIHWYVTLGDDGTPVHHYDPVPDGMSPLEFVAHVHGVTEDGLHVEPANQAYPATVYHRQTRLGWFYSVAELEELEQQRQEERRRDACMTQQERDEIAERKQRNAAREQQIRNIRAGVEPCTKFFAARGGMCWYCGKDEHK